MEDKEETFFGDPYLGQLAPQELIAEERPDERVANIAVEPLGVIERAVIAYNRHRRGTKQVLGSVAFGVGLATGAVAFSHHR